MGSEQMVLYIVSNKSLFFWTMVYSLQSFKVLKGPLGNRCQNRIGIFNRLGGEPMKDKRGRAGIAYKSLWTMVQFSNL